MASPVLFFFGALLLGLFDPSVAPTVVTLLAVLPGYNLRYPGAWPRVRPAMDLALEALEPQLGHTDLLVRIRLASMEKNSTCVLDTDWEITEELVRSENPDVLLGPGCNYDDPMQASSAMLWERPLLSAGEYQDYSFETRTPVYAGPAGDDLRVFLTLLDRHFRWTSRAVFAFSRDAQLFHRHFYRLSTEEKYREWGSHPFSAYRSLDDQPDEAVQFLRAHGRVTYIYGSPEKLQQTMHLAQSQKMTNGDYVFIYLDLLGEILEAVGHREAAKPWQSKEGRDAGGLQEAFQTVLIITAHQPQTPKYRRFQSELILRAQRDFGVALNDSLHKNLVAGCFHDVLLLYVRALNETLREGGRKWDGKRIVEKMRGLKIQGVTGTVSLNSNNEREMDFDLWSMADVESGQYQVVARYMGSVKRIKWLEAIHWKKRCPPLNNPPCVFDMNDTSYDSSFDMDDPSYDDGECVEG